MLTMILLVFAFVMIVIAGLAPVGEPWPWRLHWRLLCFGLACAVLAEIFRFAPTAHLWG